MHPSFRPNYIAFPLWMQAGYHKASAWGQKHKMALSLPTSGLALLLVGAALKQHGGWAALSEVWVTQSWCLALAVAMCPLNLGLEVAKWKRLKAAQMPEQLLSRQATSWRAAWHEVLRGQTWAFLAPFRMADGLGRIRTMAQEHRGWDAAKAFGLGALCQGWATFAMGIPALAMLGWPGSAAALGLVVLAAGGWMARDASNQLVMLLSVLRYGVFASQYLLCLAAFGAMHVNDLWSEGFPRVAGVWCVVSAIPWPAELGVREAAAAWMFDSQIPAVVAGTFVVWALNRCLPALMGIWPFQRVPNG